MEVFGYIIIHRLKTFQLLTTFLFLAILASSCKKIDPTEVRMKNEICVERISRNERYLANIIEDRGKSPDPVVIALINKSRRVAEFRNDFFKKMTRENLSVYCDSILARLKRTSHADKVLIDDIEINKRNIGSADTLTVLNLIYWNLEAELMMLEENAMQIGAGGLRFSRAVLSFTNGTIFSTKDTVLISVNSEYTRFPECRFDFSKVSCRNTQTNSVIVPKIWKTGPIYLLFYLPKEPGHYVVKGDVNIASIPYFNYSMTMYNDFLVK